MRFKQFKKEWSIQCLLTGKILLLCTSRLITSLFACLILSSAALCARIGSIHEFQQNGWFLDFGDHTAQYVNPAGMAEADFMELSAGLSGSAVRIADREFFSFVLPIAARHSFGLTFFDNNHSTEVRTTASPYLQNVYQLGWSVGLGPRMSLAVGANFTLFQFSPVEENRYLTSGMDYGLSWTPLSNARYGRLQAGLALQNAWRPGIEFSTDEISTYDLPCHLSMAVFWKSPRGRFEVGGDFAITNVFNTGDGEREYIPAGRITWFPHDEVGLKLKLNKQGYPVIGFLLQFAGERLFRRLRLEADLSHDWLAFTTEDNDIAFGLRVAAGFGKAGR
jgi:hypothetical protein